MPKSRQNKDRKQKLINFKNQHKKKIMSENTNKMPEIRQIRQIPVWAQDAKFELSGGEFLAIQNFMNLFGEPFTVMQNVFKRHMDAGTIQIRYEDENGEVSKEDVEKYLADMQEYFATQAPVPAESTVESAEVAPAKAPRKLKKEQVGS